ncbi:uncharacterized protein LODBEIA_P08280 [Lodderomyces beijingensis]|uniref:TRIP4/RQT4 C2HC5-type zinc finger domain-containing protein n=1 Tax=Lodderomyces beijingensis TaxID=1775926 RepID=A0ABP0ZFI0_9ASCO
MRNRKSTTTSQLLGSNDKTTTAEEKRPSKKKSMALEEIDAVLSKLEVEHSSKSESGRVCNCMATRHPLFEVAPNCLYCGKIICTKEGLQPCSFCKSDIIPSAEKDAIVRLLKQEQRELLATSQPVEKAIAPAAKQKKKIVVKMNPGEKFWEAQDRAFKLAERELKNRDKDQLEKEVEEEAEGAEEAESSSVDQDLSIAQERLETLLNFQSTGEERTRIIDNASDFDPMNQSVWLSPEERALNLKRQQRLSSQVSKEKDRQRRGDKQIEMVIRDGKVSMVEKYVPVKEEVTSEELQLMQDVKDAKNNLLTANEGIWDYEGDKRKWAKPVYFSDRVDSNKEESETSEPEGFKKNRVQIEANSDPSALVASML